MKRHDTIDVLIGGLPVQGRRRGGLRRGARLRRAPAGRRGRRHKDLEGNLSVEQTDHMVREGAEGLGAVGFAVGLFAPPLLAATAIGAAMGAGAGSCCTTRPRTSSASRRGRRSRSAAPA